MRAMSATVARVSLTSTGVVCGISVVQVPVASAAVSIAAPMRPRPSVS